MQYIGWVLAGLATIVFAVSYIRTRLNERTKQVLYDQGYEDGFDMGFRAESIYATLSWGDEDDELLGWYGDILPEHIPNEELTGDTTGGL